MSTKRTVVALVGPKQEQLDRVERKLGKGYKQAFDLRVVDRSGSRGLPNADLFVVWTRYAGTKMLNQMKRMPSSKVRRIEAFNLDTLVAILGPEPQAAEAPAESLTPPPSTVSAGGSAEFKMPEGDDFRFANGKLAYIRCGKCENWRPVSAFADNKIMPHGKNRLCKTCMSSINGANAHKAAKKREEDGRKLLAEGKVYYQGKKLCQGCWRYKQPTRSFAEVEKEPDGLDTVCKTCREKQRKAEERKAAQEAERKAKEAAKLKEREEREAAKQREREEREAAERAEAERKKKLGTHEERLTRLEAKFDQILEMLTDPDRAIPSLVLEEAEQNADSAAAQAQAQAAELIRQAMGDLPPKQLGKMKAQLQSALALLGDAGPDGA